MYKLMNEAGVYKTKLGLEEKAEDISLRGLEDIGFCLGIFGGVSAAYGLVNVFDPSKLGLAAFQFAIGGEALAGSVLIGHTAGKKRMGLIKKCIGEEKFEELKEKKLLR